LRKAGIGVGDSGRVAVGLGLAGLNDAADAAEVAEAFAGYALARAANDATTACIGAHAGADGGLVIAGTGSAAIARSPAGRPLSADAASRSATKGLAPMSVSMRCGPRCAPTTGWRR